MVKGGPYEDLLSTCCSAPYFSVSGDGDEVGPSVTNHAECLECGKVCDLKPKTLEIAVDDTVEQKDVPM